MSSYGSFGSIPVIRSYEDAKRRLERTKPIRGRATDVFPLTTDRAGPDRFQIRWGEECDGACKGRAIECVLHKSPVVTFLPDGTIRVKPHYVSRSTARFISEVLGYSGIYTGTKSIKWFPTLQTLGVYDGRDGNHRVVSKKQRQSLYLTNDQTVILRKEAGVTYGNKFVIVDAPKQYAPTLDQQQMRVLKKEYAPFLSYAKGLFNLRKETSGPMDGMVRFSKGEFDAMLDDKEASVDLTFVRTMPKGNFKLLANANAVLELAKSGKATEQQQTNDFYAAVLMLVSGWSWTEYVIMNNATFKQGVTNCLLNVHNDTLLRIAERDLNTELNTKYFPFLSAKQRELFGIVSKQ